MTIQLQPFTTPGEIERRSFAIIDSEVPEPRPFSGSAWAVARRLIHTTGDIALLPDLSIPDAAVEAGIDALRRSALVLTDTEMVRAGIPPRRTMPLGVSVSCLINLPGVADAAKEQGITRSRAALLAAGDMLAGSILAVGNAPTSLIALFDYLDEGGPPPALVIGMPVGFVNAAESKELLLQRDIPAIVVRGRRGGSPLAAATVNALAELALAE